MNVHHQLWMKSNSQEARVAQRWMKWWGWLPRAWGDSSFANFMSGYHHWITCSRRGSFSITMVPGPQNVTSLNGNPITSIITTTPPVGNEAMHVSIMCYNNKVSMKRIVHCRSHCRLLQMILC